jgi:hypothetical protein
MQVYDPEEDGPVRSEALDLYRLPYRRFFGHSSKAVLTLSDYQALKNTRVTHMQIIRRPIPRLVHWKHYIIRYTLQSTEGDDTTLYLYSHIVTFGLVFFLREQEDQNLEYLLNKKD